MQTNYTAPKYNLSAFHCPQCDAYAKQEWIDLLSSPETFNDMFQNLINNLLTTNIYTQIHSNYFSNLSQSWNTDFNNHLVYMSKMAMCDHCSSYSFWVKEKMVYPKLSSAPMPYPDMPENVKELYNEARLVCEVSSRSAATLLRVSLERLTEYLGEKTGNLNQRISNLKSMGLSERIINSLDIVRIYGNDGAHSNEMNMDGKDSSEIVNKLFWLVNIIVEKVIIEPKVIDDIYLQLPESKRDAIDERDTKK